MTKSTRGINSRRALWAFEGIGMEHKQARKLVLILLMVMVFFGLVSPIIGIDHPVEPFQKARALALMEGSPKETKNGKLYTLIIEGWGAITYAPNDESIFLLKGSPNDYSALAYLGNSRQYISRKVQGDEVQKRVIDWPVAMDLANKYLREIEAARGESKNVGTKTDGLTK